SSFFARYEHRLAALALEHRWPAIGSRRSFAEAGGLLAYGPQEDDRWRRAAYYVNRLLPGAPPPDLPLERPPPFELGLNLPPAHALGLTISPRLHFQADTVIRAAPAAAIPRPPEVHVTPPSADLPREVAAFSGTWEGVWNNVISSRLVVEDIHADSARVVYAWADSPQGRFPGGWMRVDAQVLPGGKLQWQSKESGATFTFTMAKDRMSLAGEREVGGDVVMTVMMQKRGE